MNQELSYIIPTHLRIEAIENGFYPTVLNGLPGQFVFLTYDHTNEILNIEIGYFSSVNTKLHEPEICLFKEINHDLPQKSFPLTSSSLLAVHEFELLINLIKNTGVDQFDPCVILNNIFLANFVRHFDRRAANIIQELRGFVFDKEKCLKDPWRE